MTFYRKRRAVVTVVHVALRRLALAMLLALAGPTGCASRPDRPVVEHVRVTGARAVDGEAAAAHLATRESSRLFGTHLTYETYDRFVVERDVRRLERYYRARGHFLARVVAGRVHLLPGNAVDVEFVVDEGPVAKITAVRLDRPPMLDADAGRALAKSEILRPGDPFDEDRYQQMKKGIAQALTDHGYAHVVVDGGFTESDLAPDGGGTVALDPLRDLARIHEAEQARGVEEKSAASKRFGVRVDAMHGTAEVFLRVDPGPRCQYGPIRFDGAGDLPVGQLRAATRLREGRPYSTSDLESARIALLELGVFSSVEYVPTLDDDKSPIVPVTFKVTQAPLHTVTLGGGLTAEVLQTDAHFVAGFENQNFLGGLRRLTMQARPGVVMFPTNLQNLLAPERPLLQIRSRAELRQPQFLEARTRGTLRSEFLVYPVLLAARTRAEVPDAVVGYYEVREAAGLDRTFLRGKLALSGFYNLQLSFPFSYFGPFDEGLRRVIISSVSFGQSIDLRDNRVKPRRGVYLGNEVQVAGGILRGDADDVRVQPDLRLYAPVSSRITAALRGSVGFLFPRSYGDTLSKATPDPSADPEGAFLFGRDRNRDLQLLFFRAFFSGGPNSNRGYPIRGVGPRGVAPFTLGGGSRALRECAGRAQGGGGVPGAAAQVAALPPVSQETLEALCFVPLGGLSMWEWSTELRVQITDKLSTLLVLDASDVTRERFTLRLTYPHLSTGTGIRYDTPVGPVRLDVGYAIPGLQRVGGELDRLSEGQPATVFGLPAAVNIAVGEAF